MNTLVLLDEALAELADVLTERRRTRPQPQAVPSPFSGTVEDARREVEAEMQRLEAITRLRNQQLKARRDRDPNFGRPAKAPGEPGYDPKERILYKYTLFGIPLVKKRLSTPLGQRLAKELDRKWEEKAKRLEDSHEPGVLDAKDSVEVLIKAGFGKRHTVRDVDRYGRPRRRLENDAEYLARMRPKLAMLKIEEDAVFKRSLIKLFLKATASAGAAAYLSKIIGSNVVPYLVSL